MPGLFRVTDANGRLVANAGFEKFTEGYFDNWTPRNSPLLTQSESNPFTGRYSARILNLSTTADRGIYTDSLPGIVSGRTYKISVQVYVTDGVAVLACSDGTSFSNEVRASSSGTGRQRLEVTKAAGNQGIRIALYAYRDNTDAYFDDVRIATATIDLIDGSGSLFHIVDWRQSIARYKNGGVFQESPMADGRRLVMRHYENILDAVEFQIEGGANEDATIEALQDLFGLMEAAADYWANEGRSAPVYIEARGRNETNTRYAILHKAEIPELPDPFSIEWKQLVLMDLTLEAEHGDWLSLPPGEGIYVALTTQGPSVRYDRSDIPTASDDDIEINITGGSLLPVANATIQLGNTGSDQHGGGFRFRTVDIPPGATILSAYIRLVSGGASTNKCVLLIQGEAADNSAAFSTYADYVARGRTANYAIWNVEDFSGAGVNYDTPDITKTIQEIIGRPGWASGNSLVVFIEDLASTAGVFRLVRTWDHPTAVEPTLYITYTYPLGQETFIANKRNEASVTHVINFDDSAASASVNAVPATLPLTLFPSSPAANDYVVFMSDTAGIPGANGGPFNNLIFNLSQGAAASSSYTIAWQYYNGSWTTLTVQDNTVQLSETGIHSVHWNQESDWTTVTVGGITGYAVRARLTALSGLFTRPVQQSLDIYTVTWPYVEIGDDIVGGDRPALARLQIINASDAPSSSDPQLYANRVIVGLRSLYRGRDFTAFFNLAGLQNPNGVGVSILNASSGTPSFVALRSKAAGQVLNWSPSGAVVLDARVLVRLDKDLANQYIGKYHLYLRGQQVSGSPGEISVQVRFGSGGLAFGFISEIKTFDYTGDDQLLDFGRVEVLAGFQITDIANEANFYIYAANNSASARQVRFYDLILIPADEWLGDFVDWDNSDDSILGRPDSTGESRYLEADGIHVPRPRAVIRNADNDDLYVTYRQNTPSAPILQKGAAQRLWFLFDRYYAPGTSVEGRSDIAISHRVVLYMAQRYKAGRGSR